jgi:hypothetical protein
VAGTGPVVEFVVHASVPAGQRRALESAAKRVNGCLDWWRDLYPAGTAGRVDLTTDPAAADLPSGRRVVVDAETLARGPDEVATWLLAETLRITSDEDRDRPVAAIGSGALPPDAGRLDTDLAFAEPDEMVLDLRLDAGDHPHRDYVRLDARIGELLADVADVVDQHAGLTQGRWVLKI